MNIVQLHERIRFWTDIVGSARFEPSDLDNAANAATISVVDEKYTASRIGTDATGFQRTQRLRDELSSIVKKSDSTVNGAITIVNSSGSSLISNFPSDYRYLLAIAIYNSQKKFNCWPITYDRINVIDRNPYRRVKLAPFDRQYYIESSEGITVNHVIVPVPNKAIIYYFATPIAWNFGIEHTSAVAFNPGAAFIVTSESAVHAGVAYLRGESGVATAPAPSLTSGTAVGSFTNSDINKPLHELIARRAAIAALVTIGENEKAKALLQYFN